MQVVVEIDDNLYTRLFDNGVDNYDDAVEMAKAIRKGTPLPKGHRVIDADEILNHAFIREDEEGDIFVQKYYCVEKEIVDNALIEADKEQNE